MPNNKKKLTTIASFFVALVILTLGLSLQTSATTAIAVTSTSDDKTEADSDEAEASSSSEANENLKERIEKIVEEKKDKVEDTMKSLGQAKKAYIGEVTRVTEEAITVASNNGTNIVPIDEKVALIKKQKTIKVEDVTVGDWLIVMGLIEDDNFVAKRVIVSAESLRPQTHIVWLGTIKEIKKTSMDFKPRSKDKETPTVTLAKKVVFRDNQGEEAEKSQFVKDLQCIVVGYKDEDKYIITTIQALASLEGLKDEDE